MILENREMFSPRKILAIRYTVDIIIGSYQIWRVWRSSLACAQVYGTGVRVMPVLVNGSHYVTQDNCVITVKSSN